MFTMNDLQGPLWATTKGNGPFHPAIRIGERVMQWPNITFESEHEAWEWARKALADALQPALETMNQWYVWP